jgi:hypothetical protein
MSWTVDAHPAFKAELKKFSEAVQDRLFEAIRYLMDFGPHLGRPHAETLEQSKFPNMKELRFKADDGVWRIAYAFDPERKAVLLVGGDKSGGSQKQFYKTLIQKADERFADHLNALKQEKQP